MRNYTAFDLEIVNDFPEDESQMDYGALGVSCAATASRDSNGRISYRTWIAADVAMTPKESRSLVDDLLELEWRGHTLVTVNGAGFDFRVLALDSGLQKNCAQLTYNYVDLCFMMLAQRGFPLGLDAMARGAGVEGKLHSIQLSDGTTIDDMAGEKAPKLWRAGEREAVLAYLKDDVRATLETCETVIKRRGIGWTARSGRPSFQTFSRLLTVAECQALPLPDTSWMSDPFTREDFLGWING